MCIGLALQQYIVLCISDIITNTERDAIMSKCNVDNVNRLRYH